MNKKYKVLSIVLNEVFHDTRVLESARAISDLDYQVTVLGIKSEESIKIKQAPDQSISLNFIPRPRRRRYGFIAFLNEKIKNSKLGFFFLQLRIIKTVKSVSINVMGALARGMGALARYRAHKYYRNNVLLFIRGFKPDIIHCNDLPVLKIAKLYKDENPRVKLVYDSHEIFSEMTGLNYFERMRWSIHEESLASSVDAFITVNPYISDILNKRNPDLPRGVVVRNAFHKIENKSHR